MSRARFEKGLSALLDPLGLRPVPGPREDPAAFLHWTRFEDLVLEVAVVYHRFYEATYTFDFYLGRTFTFALVAPGYPRFASGRFTTFTNATASRDLTDPTSTTLPGFLGGYSSEASEIAASVIQTALKGYTAQPGLADAVRDVALLETIRDIDIEIIRTVPDTRAVDPGTLRLQPTATKSSLPRGWYVAAEMALVASEAALGYPVNANHVRSFALDAWRCAETSVLGA